MIWRGPRGGVRSAGGEKVKKGDGLLYTPCILERKKRVSFHSPERGGGEKKRVVVGGGRTSLFKSSPLKGKVHYAINQRLKGGGERERANFPF